MLDQFWKKQVTLELTPEEVATIDRCLYDIPNFDNEPLPQIRHAIVARLLRHVDGAEVSRVRERVAEIASKLPSVRKVIVVRGKLVNVVAA